MVNQEGANLVLKAEQCRSTVEFVVHLCTHFLLLSPGKGEALLHSWPEVQQATEKVGRNDIAGAVFQLSLAHEKSWGRDKAYLAVACAGLELLNGDLYKSSEWYVHALLASLDEEDDDVWWATHAAVLGLCMRAASRPPASWRPFTDIEDGVPSDKLEKYLRTLAVWASGGAKKVEERRQDFEVVHLAAAAVHTAVAPHLAGAAFKAAGLRIDVPPLPMGEGGAERRAQVVDELTLGSWRFAPWITELRQQWLELEQSVEGRDR